MSRYTYPIPDGGAVGRPVDWDEEDIDGDALAGVLIQSAKDTVTKERDTHGDAVDNMQHIAAGWTWYLRAAGVLAEDERITGGQACRMMEILKLSRESLGVYDADHDRDVAGYAGIAGACEVADGNATEADLEDE